MAAERDLSVEQLRENIAEILKDADLDVLTSKKVRGLLEKKHHTSLLHRKQEIDKLLLKMIESKQDNESDDCDDEDDNDDENDENDVMSCDDEQDQTRISNGEPSQSEDLSSPTGVSDSKKCPVKVKVKQPKASDDSTQERALEDEELARKLQEQDRGLRRRCKAQVRRAKPDKEKKTQKEKSCRGYGAVMILSDTLAELMGETHMRRQDVVKKMWEIIKERNLADPKNKKFTICDDELFKVVGKKRFLTFSMLKYLKNHIKDPAHCLENLGER